MSSPLAEGFLQLRHVGHVRGQPKLDLAIVGAHQHMAGLGDEGVADLPADLGADRDVLQIGLGRGQPPGLRARQAVAGVDPPGLAVDLRLQRVGVGRFELGQLAPVEHQPRHSHALAGEPLQLVDVGRILAALALAPALAGRAGRTAPAPSCCGEPMVNGPSRRFVDALLERGDLGREGAGQLGQIVAVDLDPAPLHPADRRDQRPVDHLDRPGSSLRRSAAASAAATGAGRCRRPRRHIRSRRPAAPCRS